MVPAGLEPAASRFATECSESTELRGQEVWTASHGEAEHQKRRRKRRQGERLYGCFGFVVFIVAAPFTLERRQKPAILTRYFPGLDPAPQACLNPGRHCPKQEHS